MLQSQSTLSTERRRFSIALASSAAEVGEAQALRYRVFSEELGAQLGGRATRRDEDRFDAHCEHLLVRDHASGVVIGTYRILTPENAARAGGFYAESEFDLDLIRPLLPRTVELGRACVDPEYRNGGIIAMLLAGVLRFVLRHGCEYVMGSASVPVRDGGHGAASVCRRLLECHLSPPERRVFPRRAFVLEGWDDVPDAHVPPLIRVYLRLGAEVCGNPAWDGEFDTADLLMMLPLRNIERRYADRLLRSLR